MSEADTIREVLDECEDQLGTVGERSDGTLGTVGWEDCGKCAECKARAALTALERRAEQAEAASVRFRDQSYEQEARAEQLQAEKNEWCDRAEQAERELGLHEGRSWKLIAEREAARAEQAEAALRDARSVLRRIDHEAPYEGNTERHYRLAMELAGYARSYLAATTPGGPESEWPQSITDPIDGRRKCHCMTNPGEHLPDCPTWATTPGEPRCRDNYPHVKPCGPVPEGTSYADEQCACGCSADDVWCGQ